MELKFHVKNFSEAIRFLRSHKAKLVDRRTERYIYLDSGKLKESKRKYYFVNIRKKNNFFVLRYKQINKDTYNRKLKKSKSRKLIVNKRQNYLLERVEISLNEMNIGKFVI